MKTSIKYICIVLGFIASFGAFAQSINIAPATITRFQNNSSAFGIGSDFVLIQTSLPIENPANCPRSDF